MSHKIIKGKTAWYVSHEIPLPDGTVYLREWTVDKKSGEVWNIYSLSETKKLKTRIGTIPLPITQAKIETFFEIEFALAEVKG